MKRKYTKSPWKALPEECDKPYIRIRGTRLGERYKIANVITPVYDGVSSKEAEETRANAKLIEASPLLFEALENLAKAVQMYLTGTTGKGSISAVAEIAIELIDSIEKGE